MNAKEFEQQFDAGENISAMLDVSQSRRVFQAPQSKPANPAAQAESIPPNPPANFDVNPPHAPGPDSP